MRFDSPEFEDHLEQQRVALVNAGFAPRRHGFLVKLVRRLLWPFMRPFFLVQQHRLAVQGVLLDQVSARVGSLDDLVQTLDSLPRELAKLVEEHVLVRSDLAALKNRFALLEGVVTELTKSASAEGETTRLRLDEMGAGLTVGNQRLDTLTAEIQKLLLSTRDASDVLTAVADQARAAEERHRRSLATTNARGGLFLVKPGEVISDELLRVGAWDEHIIELAEEVAAGRSGCAVDVGAHFGALTLPLAKLFGRVHGFEPNDFNFRVLQGNVVLNGLTNVTLHNHGLFSHATTLSLAAPSMQEVPLSLDAEGRFDGHAADNLGALVFSEEDSGHFRHQALTLDSFELEDVAFVKVDVQGADGEVLLGATETLARCRPVVVFEWEEQLSKSFDVTLDDVRSSLEGLGYEISVLLAHNEKQVDYVARPVRMVPPA